MCIAPSRASEDSHTRWHGGVWRDMEVEGLGDGRGQGAIRGKEERDQVRERLGGVWHRMDKKLEGGRSVIVGMGHAHLGHESCC